jgi:hypothetical protein
MLPFLSIIQDNLFFIANCYDVFEQCTLTWSFLGCFFRKALLEVVLNPRQGFG